MLNIFYPKDILNGQRLKDLDTRVVGAIAGNSKKLIRLNVNNKRYLNFLKVLDENLLLAVLHAYVLISICSTGTAVCDSYSLSRKTVNARENFWNVYCFATNQMRDETAKDNRQTVAGISHDLI